MATAKHTQAAPYAAIEQLLAEIAGTAYLTDLRLKESPSSAESNEYEVILLRETIARMGWMADIGLHRLDSINCMHEGRAENWLLPPTCVAALKPAVQL